MTLSLMPMLSTKFNFLGFTVCKLKANQSSAKIRKQKQMSYALSRSPHNTEQMTHYTFMCELTANNFYQRNCVDLKPVPIIWFIF